MLIKASRVSVVIISGGEGAANQNPIVRGKTEFWENGMWFGGGTGGGAKIAFVRYFSRKCAPIPRKINPKVPPQETSSIAQGLYHIIKQHGPLTVSNTWNHAKVISLTSPFVYYMKN